MSEVRKTPEPLVSPRPGQWVGLAFWRSHVLPNGTDAGRWDAVELRVVSAGPDCVVCDLYGTASPEDRPPPSNLHYAVPGDVYETREAAAAAGALRSPPRNSGV
jgi:hypothetical protein